MLLRYDTQSMENMNFYFHFECIDYIITQTSQLVEKI